MNNSNASIKEVQGDSIVPNPRRNTWYRWFALGLLVVVSLVALILTDQAVRMEQKELQKARFEKITRLVQSRLVTAIQIPLNTVASMQAFMLATPELPNYDSFDQFAATMLRHTPAVTGFAYVDDQRVIRHFYPLAGNEKAIDLDLMTRPAARFVEKAIRERRMTMNPPAVTVQGRLSTIARIPLYRDGKLLGLVQGVIDIEKTLQMVLEDLDNDTHVYLEDIAGKRFWGPQDYPTHSSKIMLNAGDTQWIARVWVDGKDGTENGILSLLIWLGGGALLLSILFIVNRNFTESQRLAVAVKSKTMQLAASESRWRALLEQVHLLAVGLDRNGVVSYVNPFFCSVTGYKEDEVIGKNWFGKFHPSEIETQLQDVFEKLRQGKAANHFSNPVVTKSGQERSVSWFNARIVDGKGRFDGTLSIGEDVTVRQELEKRLDYLAYHDTVTGLPNRSLFLDRLQHAVKRAQRDNTLLALFIIDLDQFKNVNDSMGHFAGDILLQAAAQRLLCAVRSADTVARLGGDEFTILLENIKHIDYVKDVAEKILVGFSEAFNIEKNKLYITASVGIVIYPIEDDQVEDLLRAADTAMYYAKASGRNCYRFYEASMTAMAHNRLNIANNLHDALQKQEFYLLFQPIVDLMSERSTGFESLLRWQDADLGLVSPMEFIPVAESTGNIMNIGYWVLRHTCRAYQALKVTAGGDIFVSVNISSHQFRDKEFVENVHKILLEEGMAPRNLVFEITESQLMEDVQMAIKVLQALREIGCRVSIDDFGTGYSSLSYLRLFPVDILKIDRSFIADLASDNNSIALLKAIVMISDSLQIGVIAEGLETDEQLAIVKSLGITTAQGYLLGRPSPVNPV